MVYCNQETTGLPVNKASFVFLHMPAQTEMSLLPHAFVFTEHQWSNLMLEDLFNHILAFWARVISELVDGKNMDQTDWIV